MYSVYRVSKIKHAFDEADVRRYRKDLTKAEAEAVVEATKNFHSDRNDYFVVADSKVMTFMNFVVEREALAKRKFAKEIERASIAREAYAKGYRCADVLAFIHGN